MNGAHTQSLSFRGAPEASESGIQMRSQCMFNEEAQERMR
jgi:hypothetical protein